ncbi:MAG: chromosome partitioning protein ParB [Desulfobacteraceae bacterium 4572_123]|nr:MAG: chromosome partitioning protein ParB [Desulfobacteraceae bacterium 4572_123]
MNALKTEVKKRKKLALGRGLDSLIPSIAPRENKPKKYMLCDIGLIRPNRYQPRRHFAEENLADLSRSIREQGIIQPLLVRPVDTGYELVAGERRLRAAGMAGLEQVPVVIKELTDDRMLEMSIVENIQREDLNPMEEAEAYQRLMTEFSLTQAKVAERVGKSRPAVANFLRLLQLPQSIRASIMDNTLSMGHARALLGADTPVQQRTAWRTVISRGLSVRETEDLIKRLKTEKKKTISSDPSSEDIYFTDLADKLSVRFGTKVRIKRNGQKGRMEIQFFSNEDLDRLLGLLKFQ